MKYQRMTIDEAFRYALMMNVEDYEYQYEDKNKAMSRVRSEDVMALKCLINDEDSNSIQLHQKLNIFISDLKTGWLWGGKQIIPTGRSELKKNMQQVLALYTPKKIVRRQAKEASMVLHNTKAMLESDLQTAENSIHKHTALLAKLDYLKEENEGLKTQVEELKQSLDSAFQLHAKTQERLLMQEQIISKYEKGEVLTQTERFFSQTCKKSFREGKTLGGQPLLGMAPQPI